MVNVACIYALRPPENGRAANIHIHKTCILAAHNPEAAGSSPVSATTTRSVFVGKQDGFFTYTEFMKKQAEAFASACACTKVTRLSNFYQAVAVEDTV